LVIDIFDFIDVLIRFWCQRSKIEVTAGNDPNQVTYVHEPEDILFTFSGQRWRSQQAEA